VVFDNERWPYTPQAERLHPEKAVTEFAHLAHKHNLSFIGSPSPVGSETGLDRHLKADARHADILNVQVQGLEANQRRFVGHLKKASAYARSVNPNIRVVAEISSNPDKLTPGAPRGTVASTSALRTAMDKVVGKDALDIQGCWPWIWATGVGNKNGGNMMEILAHRQ